VPCPPDQQGGACVVGDADGARGQRASDARVQLRPASPRRRTTSPGLGDGQPRHLIRGRCNRAGSPNGAEVACGELPYAKTAAQMPDIDVTFRASADKRMTHVPLLRVVILYFPSPRSGIAGCGQQLL